MKDFADILIEYMKKTGTTQYGLKKKTGVSLSTLNDIILKKKSPTERTQKKIREALGFSMAEFDEVPDRQRGIERAKEWVSGEAMETALKKYETASPEGQEKRWREAVEQLKSLSPEEREAIAVIIRNLAASRK